MKSHRTLAAVLGFIALHSGAVFAQPAQRVWVVLPAYQGPIAIDTIMLVTEHNAPAGRVYSSLAKVFQDLGIPVDTRDSFALVFGNKRFAKSSMAGEAMSRALNCGTGLTGPNADNFRITMALIAIVRPNGSANSKLGVGFIGSGLDMRGAAANAVACASTGWIEKEIATRVNKVVGTP